MFGSLSLSAPLLGHTLAGVGALAKLFEGRVLEYGVYAPQGTPGSFRRRAPDRLQNIEDLSRPDVGNGPEAELGERIVGHGLLPLRDALGVGQCRAPECPITFPDLLKVGALRTGQRCADPSRPA